MDLGIGEHDPGTGGILDGELSLAVLAGDAADGAGEVVAGEGLDVLDLEGLDVEVVEAEEGDGVVDVEAEGEGAHEVLALLQGAGVGGVLGGAQLDAPVLHVHAHLQLQVLDEGRVDLGPRALERREAVRGDRHFARLDVGCWVL